MKTRSIISIVLVFAMVLMMVACGNAGASDYDANDNTDNNTSSNTDNNTDANTNGNGNDKGDGSENGNSGENGNSTGNNSQSNLSGSAEDVLNQLLEALNDASLNMPMAMPPLAVTGELSQNTLGLSESDFNRLVTAAYSSQAAIATFAHQIVMIQAKDEAAAAEIKNLVSGENGYDAMKWICVIPQSAVVINSGEYVMIIASRNEVVGAAIEAFIAAAGQTGDAIRFFENIDDSTGGVVGGGMAPMLPIEIGD